MKRLLTFVLLFFIGVLLPIGCSSSNPNTAQTPNNSASNVLNLYNWSTYISPKVIAQFEEKYNVKVNYDTYDSNESLYAKLKPGNPGYDVAFPADYMVKIMIDEGMVEPLDKNKIPNLLHIDNKFLNPPYDANNQYSVPYQWGTLGIGYNIEATGVEVDSWEIMFDPEFAGKTAWLDDMRYTFGAVLMYLGLDPNTTQEEEIQQAKNFMIENKTTVAAFVPDTGQLLLSQGEVDLTMEYSGDIFQVMEDNPNLRYVIPQEGSIIWTDNMVIPQNAPNKKLAEKFIDFVLEPEMSASISNFINYGTPNKTAIEQQLIKPENINNPSIYPSEQVFSKLKYLEDVGEATVLYDEAWSEVKLAAGS
ncbi:MAG: spermidine/putrescine ABC transporter substrate-binding protein [Microcoleaceae cyanobacterium]